MHVELLRQLRQCLLARYGGERYLGLESRAVVPAGSFRHRLSCSRQSCRVQAKNPLILGVQISRATSVPQVFSNILDELRDVSRISDARVSKIAKAFSGKGAKARANAIQNIVLHQNKKALEKGSKQALDNVRV
jgi:hypothetical protein